MLSKDRKVSFQPCELSSRSLLPVPPALPVRRYVSLALGRISPKPSNALARVIWGARCGIRERWGGERNARIDVVLQIAAPRAPAPPCATVSEIGILLPSNQRKTAPCTSRRMCCPAHCASYCAPCQTLLRSFSGLNRSPPPTCDGIREKGRDREMARE